ncbi:hypothetical protein [Fictibacillus arsenicus]|uniref:Uncharacterized protein n=1 Tax=Fictibacillus arsenicus TaxID=255247 RepID=A0A1V3G8G5_9BACL|nr:hypothetical protein [Fictibacillus arsenicus]OOE12567.1 hypothetical protein UN64_10855 [Fictibacillus arsenicus]
MSKKEWSVLAFIVLITIGTFVFYQQTHLSIWGFNLAKKDIKEVIVSTDNHSYKVTDKKLIMKIAEDVSKMEKHSKIESFNFPPQQKPKQYNKLLIRTNDKVIYGGSFWIMENTVMFESSGYYWSLDYNKISDILDTSLKNAAILN